MNRKLNNAFLIPPKQINPRISDRLNQAILEGMALEAKDRPQSMQAWLAMLEAPAVVSPPPVDPDYRKTVIPPPSVDSDYRKTVTPPPAFDPVYRQEFVRPRTSLRSEEIPAKPPTKSARISLWGWLFGLLFSIPWGWLVGVCLIYIWIGFYLNTFLAISNSLYILIGFYAVVVAGAASSTMGMAEALLRAGVVGVVGAGAILWAFNIAGSWGLLGFVIVAVVLAVRGTLGLAVVWTIGGTWAVVSLLALRETWGLTVARLGLFTFAAVAVAVVVAVAGEKLQESFREGYTFLILASISSVGLGLGWLGHRIFHPGS
jgi:hypothetical protein